MNTGKENEVLKRELKTLAECREHIEIDFKMIDRAQHAIDEQQEKIDQYAKNIQTRLHNLEKYLKL